MRIVIDRTRCVGSGMCVGIAPGVFTLDEQGELVVLQEFPGPTSSDEVESAATCCPVEAISVHDG